MAAPGSVYDLSEWHLTTPEDSGSGDAEQIDQPALATFESPDFTLDAEGRILFRANVNGFTTSGESGATRMELRQRTPSYDLMAFDPYTATQRMTLITYPDASNITGGSSPRQEMIFWQIHGAATSPPLLLAAEHDTVSEPRIRIFKDGPGVSDPVRPWTPGSPIGVRCIVSSGQVQLWVAATANVADLDAMPSPTATWAAGDFADDVSWYFKLGAYNKTTISSGSTGYSQAHVSYLELNGVVLGEAGAEPPLTNTNRFFLTG